MQLATSLVDRNEERKPASTSESLALERRVDGRLWAVRGTDERPVEVHCCFPWTEPTRFVSLRADDESEFGLVQEVTELDAASRGVLEQSLAEAGFVLEVTRILNVGEEVEIRTWKVETRQGPRSFQTNRDDWPRELPSGGFLIRDVAGDLYHVGDTDSLDSRSRELLWAFLD